ncbi:MAG: thioredoxin domain-containing protein [Bacilli bacterium]
MKKVVLFIITLLLITGCKEKNIEKFYLNNKYYNEGKFITIKNIDDLKNDTYVLYTYNNYCTFKKPCENVFKEYMEKYKIDFYGMPFDSFKKTSLYKEVRYAPSIILVKDGKIIDYLDANKNKDLDKYQDAKKFEEWINKYIYTEGLK